MVRAAELFGAALGFGDDGGGVVAADVEKGAELVVFAADYDDGFVGDVCGEKLAFFADLIEAADCLPGVGEDGSEFQRFDTRVAVPRGGDGGGFL